MRTKVEWFRTVTLPAIAISAASIACAQSTSNNAVNNFLAPTVTESYSPVPSVTYPNTAVDSPLAGPLAINKYAHPQTTVGTSSIAAQWKWAQKRWECLYNFPEEWKSCMASVDARYGLSYWPTGQGYVYGPPGTAAPPASPSAGLAK